MQDWFIFLWGGMHWEIPAALQRAGKHLPMLYLWFKRKTQLCPVSASYPPTRYMVGWTGSKQGGGQPNLPCIQTRATVEHMKLIQSFCSQACPRTASERRSKRR